MVEVLVLMMLLMALVSVRDDSHRNFPATQKMSWQCRELNHVMAVPGKM